MPRRAFTLVELLVIIAIIGLLSTVATVSLSQSRLNARNTKRKADLVQISKALELYYADNDAYPSTGGAWWGGCGGSGYFVSKSDSGANGWIPNLAPTYMARLPREPLTNGNPGSPNSGCGAAEDTCYIYRSNGTDYKVMAHYGPEGAAVTPSDPFYDPHGFYFVYTIYTPAAATWW